MNQMLDLVHRKYRKTANIIVMLMALSALCAGALIVSAIAGSCPIKLVMQTSLPCASPADCHPVREEAQNSEFRIQE